MKLSEFKELLKNADPDTDLSDILPKTEVVKIVSPEIPTEIPIPEGSCVQIKHSVNIGDLIAAMGCIKKYYDLTDRKAIVMQTINYLAQYYSGAEHPTLDEQGRQVTCNEYMWSMVQPLIESQEYVHRFEKYTGQRVDLDFDVIRGKTFVNMPHGPIQGWIPIAFPDLTFDMSVPWIVVDGNCPAKIKGQVVGKVILNFTDRYREKIDYYFLQTYAPDLIFSGTEKEHWTFCNQWGLTIPRLDIDNFLELAYALKEARFSMSNQSMLWNLAQAMGAPRVLETCRYADNCFPGIGKDSVGYFYQLGAEYNFRTMYNKTK
jgi:hypothetical protein